MAAGKGMWQWTMISGLVTLVLAVIAFFLPDIRLMQPGVIVGGLLFIAGLLEAMFGRRRGGDRLGKAAFGAGLITAAAALLFLLRPSATYYPVANIVMAWLFVRGTWVLVMALRLDKRSLTIWTGLSGVADLLLGLALLRDLPLTGFVFSIFGPTEEIVARFSLVLAASFLVTAISQIAIATIEQDQPRGSKDDQPMGEQASVDPSGAV